MIGLHVLHDQVIRRAAAGSGADVKKPFFTEALFYGIHDGNPLVMNQVGIIGHAVWHGVKPFKKVDVMVVDANVEDVVGYAHG